MFSTSRRIAILTALVAALAAAPARGAQPAATAAPADELTVEAVGARLKQLEDSQDLDETLKVKLREVYQQAKRDLESAVTWTAQAAAFQEKAASAPGELQRVKAELAGLPASPALTVTEDMTLPQFDQAISKRETELNDRRAELADLEAEPKRRASERVAVPKAVADARDRLSDADKQLQATAPADESATSTAARRILLLSRKRAAEAEILAHEKKIACFEATSELTPLRRDLAARRLALVTQEVKQLREILNRRREREAEQQVQRARLEAMQAHPAVRKLAQDNAELAEMRKGLAEKIAEAAQQLESTRQRLAAVKGQFKRIQDKVEAVGLTHTVGLLLRKQREAMPTLSIHHRGISLRQAAIRDSQLALLELEDRRSALANLDVQVKLVLHDLGQDWQDDRGRFEAAVRELLKTEKEYLDGLIGDHASHFEKLVDLDNAERQLIQETESFTRYIDERVLWIGSAPAVGLADLRHSADALLWLGRPGAWTELGKALASDARHNPVPPLVALGILILSIRGRGHVRRRLLEIGQQATRANCYRFLPTLEAVGLTLFLSAVLPAVLWYVSWRLCAELDASEWCKAVGAGLASSAKVFIVFEFLRQVCHPNGLGGSHFGWNSAGLMAAGRHIRWFLLAAIPLAFLASAMNVQENDRWRDSLGRLCFMLAAASFSLFLQRVLRPKGGVIEALLASRRGGWFDRLRYVWYPLVVLHPLVLAGAAGVGYFYTSQQLAHRIFTTIYLLLGLGLLRALLMRWALVNRRKLAIELARRRAAAQAEAGAGDSSVCVLPPPAAANRDIAAINSQTRRLIEYSLALAGILAVWFVWVDVLPALRILNRVPLWQTTITATESVRGPDGAAVLRTVEKLAAVTLADLGLAALMLATALFAGKNLPGLLEMGLLQHLPMDAGIRYAVATVSRYVITIVGVVLACNAIGLGWSKVQWMLAALGVGLGFGLNEIFANFVSGLIILFERPVRVGDVITVDNTTGVVSRIHMRATTITNWDRKELIIPNKEFITGRVLNWTLSDQVNRLVIKVGIAYGSDTERASRLLLEAAKNHPQVLDDPPPMVTFEEFGDSSLGFVLRCFLGSLESRMTAVHDLHMAIDRAFRAAGIEIAFPQQDVHVRSIHIGPEALEAAGKAASLHVAGPQGDNRARRRAG